MKRTIVFILLQVCNSLTMIGGSLITPFFPPFAREKGISTTVLGFIISANPIGSFFASLVLGKFINNKNRFMFIMIGIFLQGVGLYMYVILEWLDDPTVIVVLAGLGRLVSGIGTAYFMTPFFAFIPLMYPEDIEQKIGISEFISGGAQLIGPVFGSLLFGLGGYILPFIVFGALNILLIPVLVYTFENLNKQSNSFIHSEPPTDYSKIEQASSIRQKLIERASILKSESPIKKITYIGVMMKYPIAMQFMVVFACNICFTYFQPILANFYLEAYDIKEETVGYLMSIVTAGYAIGTVLISQVRHRKCMMVFGGLVLMGIAYFFVGPDKGFTGGDHHLWTTLASQALMGFAAANSYIPAVPILNEVLAYYYPAQTLETANVASALFTSGMSIGQLIGPIVSGLITDKVGFERACALLGLLLMGLAIIYFPMCFLSFPQPDLETIKQEVRELQKSEELSQGNPADATKLHLEGSISSRGSKRKVQDDIQC